MDMTNIGTLIGSLGFPIVMCIIMAWYIKDQGEKHMQETKALSDVINQNTIVLESLKQLLQDELGKVETKQNEN